MSNSEQSVAEILDELEEPEEDLTDLGKEEAVRILMQEEDFAKGLTAFDIAVEQVEDHHTRGAEIEGFDYDQIEDDRLSIRDRYHEGDFVGTPTWDTEKILQDIAQNEPNWRDVPDGPMNDLVHMHPNTEGGMLYDKLSQINNARIVYPDGSTGTVDIDYTQIEEAARQGASEAIEEAGLRGKHDYTHEQLKYIISQLEDNSSSPTPSDPESSDGRDDTYGVGFANAADSKDKNRRGFLRDIGIGLGALGGLAWTGSALLGGDGEEQPQPDGGPLNGTETLTPGDGPSVQTYENLDQFNDETGSNLTYEEVEAFADTSGYRETESFDFEYDPETGDLTILTEEGEAIGSYPEAF